jgi:hypothetical protein
MNCSTPTTVRRSFLRVVPRAFVLVLGRRLDGVLAALHLATKAIVSDMVFAVPDGLFCAVPEIGLLFAINLHLKAPREFDRRNGKKPVDKPTLTPFSFGGSSQKNGRRSR